jgi:hypothetical protein
VNKDKLTRMGISTVSQLAALTNEQLANFPRQQMTTTKLKKLQAEINTGISHDEKPDPILIDHTNKVNPYLSKFGSDWDSKLTASLYVKRYWNVIELAEYMVEEGLKIFPDGNFFFSLLS